MDSLANGQGTEGIAEGLPGNGVKGGSIPFGVASGGMVGALDEVVVHDGGVACPLTTKFPAWKVLVMGVQPAGNELWVWA